MRNQNSRRWRDGRPLLGAPGSTIEKCSYPRLSRENFRNGTYFRFLTFAGLRAFAAGLVFFAARLGGAFDKLGAGFAVGFTTGLAAGLTTGLADFFTLGEVSLLRWTSVKRT